MEKTSLEHLLEAAKKQNLKSLVVEQLKEARFCLEQVVNRTPELIKADRILCQKLTNDSSSQKELDIYRPIELRADRISPLVSDAFTIVHRGT